MAEVSTIHDRLENLYKSSQWSDLEFNLVDSNTGKTVILRAHRLILASASPVFEALCFGPLAEKGTVYIEDIEPSVFEILLQYIYTDKIKLLTVEAASELFYAAKKYMLNELIKLTCEFLILNVTDSSCVPLFNLGILTGLDDIVDLTLEHIRRRFDFVKDHIQKGYVCSNLIESLVDSPIINCSECDLVQLSQNWAKQVCETKDIEQNAENVRNILMKYNIYQKIRWNALTESDLQLVLPGLTPNDVANAILSLPPRQKRAMKRLYVHRFEKNNMNTKKVPDGITIRTDVKVSQTVFLKGIYINGKCAVQCFPNRTNTLKYKENIKLRIFKDDVQLHAQDISQDVEYGDSFYVKLENQITFLENCQYAIETQLLNSVLEYPYGALSKINKIASVGVDVECSEYYATQTDYIKNKFLGIVTGFEFLY